MSSTLLLLLLLLLFKFKQDNNHRHHHCHIIDSINQLMNKIKCEARIYSRACVGKKTWVRGVGVRVSENAPKRTELLAELS
jgi:hypothetical protein